MLLKTCGCGKVIPIHKSKCDSCKQNKKKSNKSYDKYKRNESSRKFYQSKEWKQLKKAVIARDAGLCQRCLNEGKITPGYICHHIVEIQDDWNKRLDINNIEYVCSSCHNKIHS